MSYLEPSSFLYIVFLKAQYSDIIKTYEARVSLFGEFFGIPARKDIEQFSFTIQEIELLLCLCTLLISLTLISLCGISYASTILIDLRRRIIPF